MWEWIFTATWGAALLSAAVLMIRIGNGPATVDRIVAFFTLGMIVVALAAVSAVSQRHPYLLTVAIVWLLLNAISSLAFCRFLKGREHV